ncbi:hypothetical protein [Rhodococcus sp. IEGM 1379]|uniref:hypothetical protein n=1 Tax=Rhodococcus sp. IEGM 1379 TaxID=3047086 RepID=UPI0024B7E437|nr:hypothetical protein [Rhodococcus sp. IEGM 1379]MDI9917193.1 hypothetical protein [Rhodococcus sp. IEGM 1379]
MGRHLRHWAVLSISAVVIVSGCGLSNSDVGEASDKVPAFDNFAPHIWSADTDIDLFSRGSELLRAAFEAGYYWSVIEEVDDFFPGYTKALGSDRDVFGNTRFETRSEFLDPVGQTLFAHITDYSATDSTVSGTICKYWISTSEGINGSVHPPTAAYRIELENQGEGPGLPGVVDSDPELGAISDRTPSWDVFGSWKIRSGSWLFGTSGRSGADGEGVPPGCHDWWLQQFQGLTYESPTDQFRSQPEGFVAPVMPLGVQFPGWIGPANVS